MKAQLTGDEAFLYALAYRIKSPLVSTKIRYKELWLTFAILDDEGLLTLSHEEIFNICQEVGVYGRQYGVEDVGHLTKRLQEYRKLQGNRKIF